MKEIKKEIKNGDTTFVIYEDGHITIEGTVIKINQESDMYYHQS